MMLNIISQQRNENQNYNEIPPTSMAIIKKTDNNCCQGHEKIRTFYTLLKCEMIQSLWKAI